jgi:DMSO/TMAO reductase YedYZ heme-binding membrane subunit
MTIIAGLTVIWTVLVLLLSKWIRKFNLYLYGIAIVVAIIAFTQETNIFNMGYVGLSFFIPVMFASSLSQGFVKKKLMGNRAELAVFGSIFSIGHGLKYLVFAIDYSFFLSAPFYFYVGVVSVLVMLPLAITSIMIIRKKMKGKMWKTLHKFSYLFYGLVALHLVLINSERLLFYIVIFGLYAVYRLIAWLELKHQKKNKSKEVNVKSHAVA